MGDKKNKNVWKNKEKNKNKKKTKDVITTKK